MLMIATDHGFHSEPWDSHPTKGNTLSLHLWLFLTHVKTIPGKHWNPFKFVMRYLKGSAVLISSWKAHSNDTEMIHHSCFHQCLAVALFTKLFDHQCLLLNGICVALYYQTPLLILFNIFESIILNIVLSKSCWKDSKTLAI